MDIVVFRRHVQNVGPKAVTRMQFLLELEDVGDTVSALVLRKAYTTWVAVIFGYQAPLLPKFSHLDHPQAFLGCDML